MREKLKSYSRRVGAALVTTYIACAMHTVFWLGKDFPDIPPMLGMVICGIYGINRFSGKPLSAQNGVTKTDEA